MRCLPACRCCSVDVGSIFLAACLVCLGAQIKAAERYLKRVEYHLSKLEDLQDQYTLHQKLRDGVRSMAYAYALSPGKEKASALSNVRSGYRECTETLCALEVKIEQLIGTLTLEMKGIQGFARLCPGDVFEVTLKHGTQKWKSRGRVCKDNTQTWDNQRTVIKGLIGEMVPSGKDSNLSPECDHDSSFGSMSARSSTADSASPLSEYRGLLSSHAALSTRTDSNSPVSDYQGLSRRSDSQSDIRYPLCALRLVLTPQLPPFSLFIAISPRHLPSCVQFPCKHTALVSLASVTCSSRRGSSASDISLLVESALECFDFLSAECDDIDDDDDHGDDDDEYYPENCRSRRDSNTSEISLSVESALECFDFLNAVCDDDFEDDHPDACEEKKNKETAALLAASCQPDTSQPVVTSSAQLDLFLYTHLRHALQLLQHLGSFGPLRSREHHSLKKLEEEGRLVAGVLAHRHNFDSLKPQHLITVPHVQKPQR
ncbi:Protein FAM65B [Portunus trituberculatus]|uniref:Protein FAM65B n=1 Tax=Portunus trituberculatus TaxID=210409 RepID=A0A5B7EBE8_PORTR|nr:Protein FAM65B [Portunus trituberculatus]